MNPEETSIAAARTVGRVCRYSISRSASNGKSMPWLGRSRHHPQLGMVFTRRPAWLRRSSLMPSSLIPSVAWSCPPFSGPPIKKVAKMRYLVSSPKLQARPLLRSRSVLLNHGSSPSTGRLERKRDTCSRVKLHLATILIPASRSIGCHPSWLV